MAQECINPELHALDDAFWGFAMSEGMRIGLMKPGIYVPTNDRDFVSMYCGGIPHGAVENDVACGSSD